jgi:predicted nucleic acid-binding protein
MADILVDSSGWGCLFDANQPCHALAANTYRSARLHGRRLVTTGYILAELVALMTSPLRMPRSSIVAFVEGVKASPFVDIIHVDATMDADAGQLLRSRLDKEWSLVDCVSLVLMQRTGIKEALTTDHHFEQAGFVRLLK